MGFHKFFGHQLKILRQRGGTVPAQTAIVVDRQVAGRYQQPGFQAVLPVLQYSGLLPAFYHHIRQAFLGVPRVRQDVPHLRVEHSSIQGQQIRQPALWVLQDRFQQLPLLFCLHRSHLLAYGFKRPFICTDAQRAEKVTPMQKPV